MKPFNLKKIEYQLLFAVIILVIFGVIMVYSTSFYSLIDNNKSAETMLKSGIVYAAIGAVAMLIFSAIDYHVFKNFSWVIFIVAIVLSIAVLIFGKEINGAKRWLQIPFTGKLFMPSEITKFAVIFIFAHIIDISRENVKKLGNYVFLFSILAVFSGLTLGQRDFSTSALIGLLGMLIMFIGGSKLIHIIASGLAVAVPGAFLYVTMVKYAKKRVAIWVSTITDRTYLYKAEIYQIIHSIYAVGTGGLLGKGFGKSELKLLRLPEAHTDFIFAIISEEFGYIPVLLLLLTYIFIIGKIFKTAIESKDTYGYVLASGIGLIIALQILINVGVVVGLLPTTGIPLPFISKGGTSLVILMSLIGVVINISYQNNTSKE